jgi:cold shock CspA family protein
MQFQGVVKRWCTEKLFGFISYVHCGRECEAFFTMHQVVADWKGSRGWAIVPNTPVNFEFEEGVSPINKPNLPRPCAENIRAAFADPEEESLETYREVSRVKVWGDKGYGFLIRPCGDEIFFHASWLVDRSRSEEIKRGDFIYHGVECTGFAKTVEHPWDACCIELYSPEEQTRLQAGLPLEEPIPETESELLQPEFRNVPLIEIVKRRKK